VERGDRSRDRPAGDTAVQEAAAGGVERLCRTARRNPGRVTPGFVIDRSGKAHVAQLVERVLGKDEVSSSILLVGSRQVCARRGR
jgi:hypothetical protein